MYSAHLSGNLRLKRAKTTMGERVVSMIYNGLGFIDDRLYMFPEFLENKPVDRLFERELKAEFFNDDALGRCLDSIHSYGVTKLFSEIAFEIGIEQKLLGHTFNIDSTSLTVYGDYEEEVQVTEKDDPEKMDKNLDPSHAAVPKRGYSKAHRHDLKQMVLNLATTGKAGMPIWMEAHSGNASDKKILYEASQRMRTLCNSLKEAPSFLIVGDSAMYDACMKDKSSTLWLTRVPENHKIVKELLSHGDEAYGWEILSEGYKVCSIGLDYQSIKQHWAIVFSEQAYLRECLTLEKNIKNKEKELTKKLWHLGNSNFLCQKDAQRALDGFSKNLLYHQVSGKIEPVLQYKGAGRPAKDAELQTVGYRITGTISRDDAKITKKKNRKGKFILATNQLNQDILSAEAMLFEYKGQAKTESGFKFIKDDAFEVSSIFLKKPERIVALMMIMTLCLMVYGISQYHLRTALLEAKETIPSPTKKETAKPTMKRIYRLFHGVQVITLDYQDIQQEIVINLKELHKRIIKHFGSKAMEIYGIT